jgi:hypothetical protein
MSDRYIEIRDETGATLGYSDTVTGEHLHPSDLLAQRDEARAEVERLRAALKKLVGGTLPSRASAIARAALEAAEGAQDE